MIRSIPSILARILAKKRQRLSVAKHRRPIGWLKSEIKRTPPPRDFWGSLAQATPVAIIAEIKRRSPSKGSLAPRLEPGHIARSYEQGGASAISVLTEQDFFGGSAHDLLLARNQTSLPILRKDFIFDPYQLYESRAMQADAVLLIARCLKANVLAFLIELTHALGMSALIEVHSSEDVGMALETGARIIGINNRDLSSFETDLATTERLAPLVPKDRLIVSESGIRTAADLGRVKTAGVRAVLVGEAIVKAAIQPGGVEEAIRGLMANQESAR